MANGKIKGKQIEDSTLSLDKLSGAGSVTIGSASSIQITGTASNPNDVVTFKQIQNLGGAITVTDYLTGASFSGVENIIFRGQTVTVPGGTSTGVLAANDPQPNSVVVWIPAPSYVGYINLTNVGFTSRFISSPTSEGTPYNIGAFSTASAQNVTRSNMVYNVSEFGYFDDTATFEINVYDFDDTTAIDSLSFSMADISSGGSTVSGSITFQMLSKDDDQDRRKADIRVTIDPSVADAAGGRLTNEIIFTNSEGGGAGDDSVSQTYFYDSEGSSADIDIPGGGTVSIEEKTAVLKYVSGVSYYDTGSSFTFSVTNIDNLNDRSYPLGTSNQISDPSTSHQLEVDPSNNFRISNTYYAANTDFNSWSTLYNVQNLSYNVEAVINQVGVTPGLNANNTLNTSNYPNITATLFDWTVGDSEDSPDYPCLIDTANDASDDTTEFFVDEDDRLSFLDLVNGGVEVSFDSEEDISVSTGTYSYELQQIFGHLVFPKINFSSIYPQYNIDNSIDYSGSGTQSVTLTVINNITSLSTTTVTHSNHRWYARKFSTGSALTTRGAGIFAFDTDFAESDLITQNDGSAGNSNLLLYLGLTNNTVPTAWYDLSKFSSSSPIQGPRSNATGGGSSNLDSNGEIQWNTGAVQGWTAYLLVGIRNTSDDKEIEQIELNDTDDSDWGT